MEGDEFEAWPDGEFEEQEEPPEDWNGPCPGSLGETTEAEESFCSECGAVVRHDVYYKTFRIATCYECRQHDPLLSLVPKASSLALWASPNGGLQSKAASEFLLPASTLRTLPNLERSNPMKPTYQPMKLYLRRDV